MRDAWPRAAPCQRPRAIRATGAGRRAPRCDSTPRSCRRAHRPTRAAGPRCTRAPRPSSPPRSSTHCPCASRLVRGACACRCAPCRALPGLEAVMSRGGRDAARAPGKQLLAAVIMARAEQHGLRRLPMQHLQAFQLAHVCGGAARARFPGRCKRRMVAPPSATAAVLHSQARGNSRTCTNGPCKDAWTLVSIQLFQSFSADGRLGACRNPQDGVTQARRRMPSWAGPEAVQAGMQGWRQEGDLWLTMRDLRCAPQCAAQLPLIQQLCKHHCLYACLLYTSCRRQHSM